MDQQAFQGVVEILSREHSFSILRSLRDGSWHLSSEVARALEIHITTASKFLQRVAEVHRDLWAVCSQGLGANAAKGVFQEALRDAMNVYPDLAIRCGLTRPLEP